MPITKATLRAFDAGTYRATIEYPNSPDSWRTGVPTSRAIPAAEMTAGRTVAVAVFDPLNPADAMIVGIS